MTEKHELVQEGLAIRTVAADLQAKLMNTTDPQTAHALAQRLAELYERHEIILSRISRLEAA